MSSPSSKDNGRGTPAWLDAVRRFERTIGSPVERFVTSDTYFDMLPQLRRAQAQMEELTAAVTEEWYKLLNLPTGKDVRQMREQMSRMERQIEKLTKQLADRDAAAKRTNRKRDQTG
jgi:hypothetical protein